MITKANRDQIPECKCNNPFSSHRMTLSLAECNVMYQEHFGEEGDPSIPYVDWMRAVTKEVGCHHIIEDINALRSQEFDYVGGNVKIWGGFCTKPEIMLAKMGLN